MAKRSSAYKQAGVDINKANRTVKRMARHVKSTHNQNVLSGIGSFGGMFDISFIKNARHPVLVQSADGVGTKVNIAEMMKKYTIGQDIVNHCVNDILVHGATPLTFLDYLAADKLLPNVMIEILANMAIACRQNKIAITAGETAEMPSVYFTGKHDVAGFITGIVEKDRIINGSKIEMGDALIGLLSNGLHTNGYSLARKIFFEKAGYNVETKLDELEGLTLGEELLRVHRSYLKIILPLLDDREIDIHGIAHITGGGFFDNIGRLINKPGLCAEIACQWRIPPVFRYIQEIGKVSDEEMRKVFNLGIGMILIVPSYQIGRVQKSLFKSGESGTYVLGSITKTQTNKKVAFIKWR